jgi:hypothetical protein
MLAVAAQLPAVVPEPVASAGSASANDAQMPDVTDLKVTAIETRMARNPGRCPYETLKPEARTRRASAT